MKKRCRYGGWAALSLLAHASPAQPTTPPGLPPATAPAPLDVADVAHRLWARLPTHDALALQNSHPVLLLVPVADYSQQTGGVVGATLDLAWQRPGANVSTVGGEADYTLHHQLIFTLTSSCWTAGNGWNLAGDWRVMHYPQSTYGLGMFTSTTERVVAMDYTYFRFYQTALRRVAPAWYVGLGYQFDNYWNILSHNGQRAVTTVSHYRYGVSGRAVSSGPSLTLLHDSRTNAINPQSGLYLQLRYRPSLRGLGSSTNHQGLLLEGRTYLHPSPRSANILAFWSYNAFTLTGNPPFLDLPATGWDTYGNLGRSFIQGRYRGKNLLYDEAEYRFGITRNHLLGGVVFANAESVTEVNVVRGVVEDGKFEKIVPAVGGGLRLTLNKVSHTNLAVDYGFGFDGSQGLSLNLGEVF